MSWYIREVIPRIASLAGPQAAALVIVGKNWQYKDVPESKHVTYAGYVTDSELRSYYQSRCDLIWVIKNACMSHLSLFIVTEGRSVNSMIYLFCPIESRSVFVSPLLNGTGIATKIFNAVVKGMPVVTTPLGLNGFGLTQEQVKLMMNLPCKFCNIMRSLSDQRACWCH